MTTQNTQAVFFDFDGVLVDSTAIKTEAFRQLFQAYGKGVVRQVITHHQQHGGISRVEKIRHIHQHVLGRSLREQEVAEWAARYSSLVVEQVVACRWIAGAEKFLQEMSGSIPLFVISGTPEEELVEIVQRRGMDRYFKAIHGSPVRKPEHVRNLLDRYCLDPAHCLFVGDAMTDYLAARETGVPFIGIQGEVPFPEDTEVLPDCRQLAKWVRRSPSSPG